MSISATAQRNVLAISAHCDDIELGCGAALRCHARRGDNVYLIVTTRNGRTASFEKRFKEQRQSIGILGIRQAWLFDFDSRSLKDQDVVMPKIKELVDVLEINMVYTPDPGDTHADHICTTNAVIPAARSCSILFYQLPSTVNFVPNLYLPVDDDLMKVKKAALMCHNSQVSRIVAGVNLPSWIETIGQYHALGFDTKTSYAEAFHAYRMAYRLGSE